MTHIRLHRRSRYLLGELLAYVGLAALMVPVLIIGQFLTFLAVSTWWELTH
jgi:hypothetical protein